MRVKPLQSCPALCDPKDWSPPGSSVHGDSPGRNTRVGCQALLQGIFPTQGWNPHLSMSPALQAGSLPLASPGKPCDLSVGWGLRFWLSAPGGAERGAREAAQGSQAPPGGAGPSAAQGPLLPSVSWSPGGARPSAAQGPLLPSVSWGRFPLVCVPGPTRCPCGLPCQGVSMFILEALSFIVVSKERRLPFQDLPREA